MRDPRWWGEQVLHALVGFGIAALVLHGCLSLGGPFPGSAALGLCTSSLVGFIREGAQNWGDEPEAGASEDMLVDVGAWVLGACLAPLTAL